MPTYEYRCARGHAFERVQKMSEPPIEICDVCGAEAVRAISGGAGLIFKGSGFYITDYGKDGKGARKDSDASSPVAKPAESKTESSAAKTDATPAPKTESKPAPKADAS